MFFGGGLEAFHAKTWHFGIWEAWKAFKFGAWDLGFVDLGGLPSKDMAFLGFGGLRGLPCKEVGFLDVGGLGGLLG